MVSSEYREMAMSFMSPMTSEVSFHCFMKYIDFKPKLSLGRICSVIFFILFALTYLTFARDMSGWMAQDPEDQFHLLVLLMSSWYWARPNIRNRFAVFFIICCIAAGLVNLFQAVKLPIGQWDFNNISDSLKSCLAVFKGLTPA